MKIETLRERIEKKQAQIEKKQNTIVKKEKQIAKKQVELDKVGVDSKEGRARVESIYAGGYNIQKLHIRTLVHSF